jgi:hypothetical protein
LNSYCHSLYVTSSLKRGWVCRLQLLALSNRIHSRVLVPQDSRPHFTLSDSRPVQNPPIFTNTRDDIVYSSVNFMRKGFESFDYDLRV